MNYAKVLGKCHTPDVGKAIDVALRKLFEEELQLLKLDVHERTIMDHLARYLRPSFRGYDIDVDYNRMGDAPKSVTWKDRPDLVYPDIIVHRRMTNAKTDDIEKLRAYRRELSYQHALFVRFGIGSRAGEIVECEWVL